MVLSHFEFLMCRLRVQRGGSEANASSFNSLLRFICLRAMRIFRNFHSASAFLLVFIESPVSEEIPVFSEQFRRVLRAV